MIEASEPPKHCKFLLRMLKNTILSNGHQNIKRQVLNAVMVWSRMC